ncbi:hypothetical protein D0A37_04670 [Microcoleus vaginatus HSN003]|nr:hypothetical protein D0A37_04670 [Microcoleus vaginatus HSN003]
MLIILSKFKGKLSVISVYFNCESFRYYLFGLSIILSKFKGKLKVICVYFNCEFFRYYLCCEVHLFLGKVRLAHQTNTRVR